MLALVGGLVITPMVSGNTGYVNRLPYKIQQYFIEDDRRVTKHGSLVLISLTWALFFIFTFLHLYANFCAVSSVVMETVNIPRLHILVTEFLTSGFIMTPQEVGSREPIIFGNVIELKRTNVEIQSHA